MNIVKTFDEYMFEGRISDGLVSDSAPYMKHVIQLLTAMQGFSSKVQSDLATLKLGCIKPIKCVPAKEVLNKDSIRIIKSRVRPKEKCCYEDAFHTASYITETDVKYCEGYLIVYGLPIEHAFNKVGDCYIDVTREFGGHDDVTQNEYVILKEWDADVALRIMAHGNVQCYGGVFDKEYYIEHNLI